MIHLFRNALAVTLMLILAAAAGAQSLEIKLKDGTRWRGSEQDNVRVVFLQQGVEVTIEGTLTKAADLYIIVDGKIGGVTRQRTIFKSDIVSMTTLQKGAANVAQPTVGASAKPEIKPSEPVADSAPPTDSSGRPLGVFLLPLKGTVGETMRHEEIEAIAKEADKYGPGQIIVLEIDSPGGLMLETEQIHMTIQEVRKRHRVVAWIRAAISAAAATASNCHEIYFTSSGTLGAMTAFSPATGKAVQGEELRKWLEAAGRWMEAGGRSKYIAWAMIDEKALLSYDKDPVTGEVTWYNDLSGEFDLSDEKQNLVFTASTATHSRFADGVADTHEELAKLLNLPKWHEISDRGRRLAEDWHRTVERAKTEIPMLFERYNNPPRTGGPVAAIGKQIDALEKLIGWWGRCPNMCFLSGVPPKEELERIIEELRLQIARMRNR